MRNLIISIIRNPHESVRERLFIGIDWIYANEYWMFTVSQNYKVFMLGKKT